MDNILLSKPLKSSFNNSYSEGLSSLTIEYTKCTYYRDKKKPAEENKLHPILIMNVSEK